MLDRDTCIQKLTNSILFSGIAEERIHACLAAGIWSTQPPGSVIYRQGDANRHFHIVAEGEVELSLNVAGDNRHIIGYIGPGGHFGETSLLTGDTTSQNAIALTEVTLISFSAEVFNSVLLADPFIQHHLCVGLAKRLQVSFHDHVHSLTTATEKRAQPHNLDQSFLIKDLASAPESQDPVSDRGLRFAESTIARQIDKAVQQFGSNLHPVLLTGESGTGRRMIASEIHRASILQNGPYKEIDVRNFDAVQLEAELFGMENEATAFVHVAQRGIFERLRGGTVTLYNAEFLEPDCQRQIARLLKKIETSGEATGESRFARLILICNDTPGLQDGHNRLLPTLYSHFARQHFRAAPLRNHRRDIPRLVQYYVKRYCLQHGKTIHEIDEQTLGRFMNYDWPGNLTELSGVIQRAVLLGRSNEPLHNQVILGLPKSEGKWEFNLLRLAKVRAFLSSRIFPVLPRIIVGICLLLVLLALFLGPLEPEKNIGLTLGWVVGWPLLIFSFFFFARTWCSICGLSVPGWLAQLLIKPTRPTPPFIRKYSGWLMAAFCIILFYIEIAWNAYQSPHLTAWIIATITLGSLVFSMFFQRRVWCRYLCPLGAINSLFAMPSILELRSNNQMCINRCPEHLCYNGDEQTGGCPMFRHPFLVDNNRDCILCGQCIKNCKLHSIHLNLRLAPQELWNQQSPRLEDSFLVVSLAAIFFPFAFNQKDPAFLQNVTKILGLPGFAGTTPFTAALIFLGVIGIYGIGYVVLSAIMAKITGNKRKTTAAIFGYGMIPLVLGAYMAIHLEILINGLWLLPANLIALFGGATQIEAGRLMSRDTTFMLQLITIGGGLAASLYATGRIVKRLATKLHYQPSMTLFPAFLLFLSAIAYLLLL